MARLWRVHQAELPDEAGATVELPEAETHHVQRVLRLQAGDALGVFDGAGTEWRAVIEAADGGRVRVRLDRRLDHEVEATLEIVLYQGLCRADRMEWLVQKATELGVAVVRPLAGAATGPLTLGDRRLERLRRIALEATKQSGRRRIPAIEPVPALPRPAADGVLALLLDPGPDAEPLDCVCARVGRRPRSVWIAVGPEGGFDDPAPPGWRVARLGPRTLRSETAGLVAASILLHLWGDLGASVDSPASGS